MIRTGCCLALPQTFAAQAYAPRGSCNFARINATMTASTPSSCRISRQSVSATIEPAATINVSSTPADRRIARAITAAIRDGADVVIVNRFGKLEAEGRGLIDLIDQAVAADIPVLIAVPEHRFAAWIKDRDAMSCGCRAGGRRSINGGSRSPAGRSREPMPAHSANSQNERRFRTHGNGNEGREGCAG